MTKILIGLLKVNDNNLFLFTKFQTLQCNYKKQKKFDFDNTNEILSSVLGFIVFTSGTHY